VTAAGPTISRADADSGLSVETHGLTKRYGATTAIHDVDPRGCAFGYLCPNGAGKPNQGI
jgi:ABC-2 type transport system ATP-binding protein